MGAAFSLSLQSSSHARVRTVQNKYEAGRQRCYIFKPVLPIIHWVIHCALLSPVQRGESSRISLVHFGPCSVHACMRAGLHYVMRPVAIISYPPQLCRGTTSFSPYVCCSNRAHGMSKPPALPPSLKLRQRHFHRTREREPGYTIYSMRAGPFLLPLRK